MDRQPTYSLSLFGDHQSVNGDQTNKQIQQELVDFILEFHLENVFVYRYARRSMDDAWKEQVADATIETKYERMSCPSNTTATSTSPTSSHSTSSLHTDSTTSPQR